MNLLSQVEPLSSNAASQASSRGGLHTATRRDSLSIQQWLKRASDHHAYGRELTLRIHAAAPAASNASDTRTVCY